MWHDLILVYQQCQPPSIGAGQGMQRPDRFTYHICADGVRLTKHAPVVPHVPCCGMMVSTRKSKGMASRSTAALATFSLLVTSVPTRWQPDFTNMGVSALSNNTDESMVPSPALRWMAREVSGG